MAKPSTARIVAWVYIFTYWAVFTIFSFYAPTAADFTYTYQYGTPPGTLTTRRWTYDFVVVGFFALLWTIPITLAFVLDDDKGTVSKSTGERYFWRQYVHNALVIILLLWYFITFVISSIDWANANKSNVGNYYNRANDPRWCCVYFNLPGAPCVNTASCSPGVGASDLVTNRVFLFQYWFGFVLVIALVFDLLLMICLVNPSYQNHGGMEDRDEPLLPDKNGSAISMARRVGSVYKGK